MFGFSMGLGIGVQTFNGTRRAADTWQSLSLTPDISFGKLGVGHRRHPELQFQRGLGKLLHGPAGRLVALGAVTLQSVAAIYLPKIAYVRWGLKGDPLFLKLGSFNDATLGDGFIMGDYNNTLFLPTERHFGLQADLDGNLFNFPYVGIETVVGNLAQSRRAGGPAVCAAARGHIHPHPERPAGRRHGGRGHQPVLRDTSPRRTGTPSTVAVFGAGVMLPLVYVKDVFSLVCLHRRGVASRERPGAAWSESAGGSSTSSPTAPSCDCSAPASRPRTSDPTYDLQRDAQYNALQASSGSGSHLRWPGQRRHLAPWRQAHLQAHPGRPVRHDETDPTAERSAPECDPTLSRGVVPVFSFDFSYDKKAIGTFSQLVDATNAAIQAKVNSRPDLRSSLSSTTSLRPAAAASHRTPGRHVRAAGLGRAVLETEEA